ncbi:MAG TPA: lipoprotein-releasing system ATP-binding protein LolD, partial [Firmicutes bacterium]|nr:lipoprotein-releasing system ATP-binding protein LolD [Bacillota bacterium]
MELISINKVYNQNRQNEVRALKNINIKFDKGKFYAIMGRSGSGKTTLINILGLMDKPTDGTYILNGLDTNKLNENEKAILRNESLGFVFQSYYLESKLTAFENVILPSLINNK